MGRSLVLLVLLMTSIAGWAQEAYSVFTEDDSTLTFFYDEQRSTRTGVSYLLSEQDSVPAWHENHEKVTHVVFDTTFVAARPTSTRSWFYEMAKLDSITGIKYLKTDSVTDMASMFWGCYSLTSLDLSGFNTSNVTDMSRMLGRCTSVDSFDLSGFNTSKVTNMELMFYQLSLTALDVSSFNTGNVENMFSMFAGCNYLTSLDVSGFNTSNVTDMTAMFADCDSLTLLDVSGFNTGNVTTMSAMFSGCESLDSLDLSHFNTSNVSHMGGMFAGCRSLRTLDLSHLNTASVIEMDEMFNGCISLETIDLSGFKTNSVITMQQMFRYCTSLTSLDLSGFNTSNVTAMNGMFGYCTSLTSLDLSGFNTSNVTAVNAMFYGCNRLETIYAGKGWNTDSVVNSDRMFYGCTSLVGEQGTKYDENHVDADYAHIDEGPTNPGYLSRKRIAYALLSADETKLTFYYDDERSIRQGTTYLLMEANNHGWSEHAGSVTQVLIDSTFVAARPTSTNSWFLNMDKIDSIAGIEFLNTSAVTDMRRMFAGCVS
ncbi:MAG: BspA family leucine-rich repeat surface protein, partial [Muribaculaceae bacterium]|nr:BspA family leucine-rich repeat surface protein [Muribaculaceae bacterium]